jgi:hypothetical protein
MSEIYKGTHMSIDIILALILVAFSWFIAPAIIIHYKGRRWWAWLPLSIVLPGAFLIFAMFMHGIDKDGKILMS